MKGIRIYSLIVLLLSVFVVSLAGCGGSSGGSGGSTGDATVSGKVADGYVSGADVYAYSDADLTNQIGAGSTDSEGNFSMVLSVSSVPNPVYFKSVGGTDVETGMPAPTMLFVGSGSSGTFNITPLTDCLYKYSLTMGFDEAKEHLIGTLSISEADLFDDPVANTDLTGALNSVLSSGAMEGTLADGDYVVTIVFFDSAFGPGQGDVNVTISNGVVSAPEPLDIFGTSFFLTGKVQGSSIVLTLADDPDPLNVAQLVRIAGDIGLLGSVSGAYTSLETEIPVPNTGMFVASFLPVGGYDSSGVANVISSIYSGPRHLIFRDVFNFGSLESHLGWGDLNITDIDFDTNTIVAEDTTIWLDWGTDPAAGEEIFAPPFPVSLQFEDGYFFETLAGPASHIICLEFEINPPSGDRLYLLQPVGSRRGFFAIEGETNVVGDAYMATGEGLAPSLMTSTDYQVKVAAAHGGMLGLPRADWIGSGTDQMPYSDSFTTPAVFDNANPDFSGNLLKIYNGSLIAFKNDDDNGGLNNGFDNPDLNGEPDFVRLVELYESGAIQGEETIGGDPELLGLANPLSWYPATFVGFVKKSSESAPSVSGTRNFLARTIYGLDPFAYVNAYVTGDLTISGSSATLNWTEGGGTSGTASLNAENMDGLYHMHGNLDSSTYIDIFWPVGGKKSVYITSDWDEGLPGWVITEVGEAFITH
jgi:hypothetical protein